MKTSAFIGPLKSSSPLYSGIHLSKKATGRKNTAGPADQYDAQIS